MTTSQKVAGSSPAERLSFSCKKQSPMAPHRRGGGCHCSSPCEASPCSEASSCRIAAMSARSSDEGLGRDEGVKKVTAATSLVGEIEYEFDVTKVTFSVNLPYRYTILCLGMLLTPSVAPPRARGAPSGRRASYRRPHPPRWPPQKRGLPAPTPPLPGVGRSRIAVTIPN
jgi:hypothetical protein